MSSSPERDPIRIVPLALPEGMATIPSLAAAQPKLTYRGGPLLAAVGVQTVFWGSAWSSDPTLASLLAQINGFFQFVLTSPLIDELAEYSVTGYTIGHGSLVGTTTLPSDPPASLSDAAIQTMLQQQIAAGTLPQPNANSLYFVYTPPGVTVTQGGSRSCQAFCGYHDNINGTIFYAVEPYADCTGCLGGMAVFDALTVTSSHELCEAITDPIPGQGWYDDTNGEIGDICAWKTKQLGAYTVQLEWSNSKSSCI